MQVSAWCNDYPEDHKRSNQAKNDVAHNWAQEQARVEEACLLLFMSLSRPVGKRKTRAQLHQWSNDDYEEEHEKAAGAGTKR